MSFLLDDFKSFFNAYIISWGRAYNKIHAPIISLMTFFLLFLMMAHVKWSCSLLAWNTQKKYKYLLKITRRQINGPLTVTSEDVCWNRHKTSRKCQLKTMCLFLMFVTAFGVLPLTARLTSILLIKSRKGPTRCTRIRQNYPYGFSCKILSENIITSRWLCLNCLKILNLRSTPFLQ